jgi:hypothetical protein
LSASELGELVKLNFDLRTGEGVQTLLCRKLAERWGGPLLGFGAWATDQGQILEEQAVPWYEFTHNVEVARTGFLMNDEKTFGCSPDGVVGDWETGFGLEVKCFQPPHHCKVLLDGEVPREHLAQIHGGMFVTGFQNWQFLAYHRSYPKLVVTVQRDEEIQEKIAAAVEHFATLLEEAWEKLVDLNNGIVPTREPMVFAHEHFVSEMPS